MSDDLETLCQSCGMCCDGTLFGRVSLERDEVQGARRRKLAVVKSGTAFEQPCAALVAAPGGSACAIYTERPRACRRFACRLYERQRAGAVTSAAALEAVRRVRALMAEIESTGLGAGDFADEAAVVARGPEAARALEAYREVVQRMENDFARS